MIFQFFVRLLWKVDFYSYHMVVMCVLYLRDYSINEPFLFKLLIVRRHLLSRREERKVNTLFVSIFSPSSEPVVML